MATITFVGLGNMGGPMALNLIKAGHSVYAIDLMPELVESLVREGAHKAQSLEDAVKTSDVIITMLPAGKHVASLFLGEPNAKQGLLEQLSNKPLIIDSSTIDAATARSVHDACRENGIDMVDAPVSGGVAAAAAGSLTFMCGGDAVAFEKAQPILGAMGANIFHAGPEGAGQVAKMCNNMLLAIHMIGTSEALNLGANNGLDPSVLSEIMLASSGKNWSLEKYNPYPNVMPTSPASNDYRPGFMVDLMAKDLGLAMENAVETSSKTPLGRAAHDMYVDKQDSGEGKKDFSSILEDIAK
ncbi:MAG: 3-hydroxyisobutyrate dehydrogenase [Oleiphilaceae bacterium]|uniref:3-hydroxyisobutyrate dehydrogenase n=1 Tax=Oleiphilus sp. HI0125 TaxID=1822266 RepID=UPI0007C35654|nr:3-hydroxyisobutyrate dehydrogenase [Oleiphilus sp. HI0125]KZZ59353.1 3-hydroxyisobutyrate dehydrogenase [Oleiphilus sp. HI0125]MCH2159128.1 3-hydroxyisobutyrate dehydrogenase [Oleiphilaceae bacterium]